jgi:hypothetical protein
VHAKMPPHLKKPELVCQRAACGGTAGNGPHVPIGFLKLLRKYCLTNHGSCSRAAFQCLRKRAACLLERTQYLRAVAEGAGTRRAPAIVFCRHKLRTGKARPFEKNDAVRQKPDVSPCSLGTSIYPQCSAERRKERMI